MRTLFKGQNIPYGLSLAEDRYTPENKQINLMLPLMVWYRRGYNVINDEFFTGWWTFRLLLAFEVYRYSGFRFKFKYGWAR